MSGRISIVTQLWGAHEHDFTLGKLRYWRSSSIELTPTCRVSRSASLSTRFGGRISVGERTTIYAGALIWTYGGDIEIGNDCSVNPYTVLYGHGGLVIGDAVRIAAHCTIVPANHVFSDRGRPIMNQGMSTKGIRIGSDVWIGTGVRILDGADIGTGCVIAAGAVVNAPTEPFSIYGGVPARKIGDRGEKQPADAFAERLPSP